ncbi:MAG TPA: hypothetical protein VFY49_07335 [Myxococcota bacterium]|nr:hypothetical protein [Myxococcota bacterium]
MPDRSADARVFEAASRFFAALLGAGRINETNQPGILRYCIRAAQQLVEETDRALRPQPEPQASAGDLDLDMELEELAEKKPEGTAYRAAPAGRPPGGRPTP